MNNRHCCYGFRDIDMATALQREKCRLWNIPLIYPHWYRNSSRLTKSICSSPAERIPIDPPDPLSQYILRATGKAVHYQHSEWRLLCNVVRNKKMTNRIHTHNSIGSVFLVPPTIISVYQIDRVCSLLTFSPLSAFRHNATVSHIECYQYKQKNIKLHWTWLHSTAH